MNSPAKSSGVKDVRVRYWVEKNSDGKDVFGGILNVELLDGRIREIHFEDVQPVDTWPKAEEVYESLVKNLAPAKSLLNTSVDGDPASKKIWARPDETPPPVDNPITQ